MWWLSETAQISARRLRSCWTLLLGIIILSLVTQSQQIAGAHLRWLSAYHCGVLAFRRRTTTTTCMLRQVHSLAAQEWMWLVPTVSTCVCYSSLAVREVLLRTLLLRDARRGAPGRGGAGGPRMPLEGRWCAQRLRSRSHQARSPHRVPRPHLWDIHNL